MTRDQIYWVNLVNMHEIHGPFKNHLEAIAHAKKKFKEPPDNGKDHYRVGIGIVKVVCTGELNVSVKAEWEED